MAWVDLLTQDGVGVTYRVDISLDGFSTIAYRYAMGFLTVSANDFDPRLLSVGSVHRALGGDFFMESGSLPVTLANDDGGVDWMMESATAPDVLKARVKLYQGLYDKATYVDSSTSIQWKQLGEYIISDFPERDRNEVRFVLSDISFGILAESISTPTLADWYAGDSSATTNPLRDPAWFLYKADKATPLQLAWGSDPVLSVHAGHTGFNSGGQFSGKDIWVACVTTSTSEANTFDFSDAGVIFDGDNGRVRLSVPRFFYYSPYPSSFTDVFHLHKGGTFSKGGKDWKVIFLALDHLGFARYTLSKGATVKFDPICSQRIVSLWQSGQNLSARTVFRDFDDGPYSDQHPVDVMTDLVSHYSLASSAYVDTASFARVKASVHAARAAGTVGASGESQPLRDTLAEICQSSDIDAFVNWDGKLALASRNLDYASQTDTLISIDESRLSSVTERFPSRDNRGAPFNRITLTGVREDEYTQGAIVIFGGPYDSPAGTVATWGRGLTRELQCKWRPLTQLQQDPWAYRQLESSARPLLSCTTTIEALQLDLGDYVQVTWTRNLGDPHAPAYFQVQGMTLHPSTNTVDLELLWCGDLRSLRPYILDDETITRRVASGGGRTATVVDSDATVLFSSGSLISDGVAAGDHLILRDATEAATGFQRNRALKIASITDATHLEITESDLDFDAGAGIAVATWEIRRSHLTYATLGTDPTNYPAGADVYGRVADLASGGVYSGAGTGGFTTAHFLMDG